MKWSEQLVEWLRDRPGSLLLGSRAAYIVVILLVTASLVSLFGWSATCMTVLVAGVLIAIAAIARKLRLLANSVAELAERIDRIRDRVDQYDQYSQKQVEEEMSRAIDLASIGTGDPSRLAAARLDRDMFPRLTTMMDLQPPTSTSDPNSRHSMTAPENTGLKAAFTGLGRKDLLHNWKTGLRNRDLESCRAVFAALVDTVDAATLEPLKNQLEQLADDTEAGLRREFTDCRKRGDVRGMIRVGRQICRLLPERHVAQEFRTAEPHLQRIIDPGASYPTPALRVHH